MELTASGKARTVTVSFRLPEPIHQQAVCRARNRGVRLSQLLRDVVALGLKAEQPMEQRRQRNA